LPLTLAVRFSDSLNGLLAAAIPARLGVAVSGGGDSLALLHLMHDWARANGSDLRAVTVDHGLRAAAPQEARQVARICADLGIVHETLRWSGWDQSGNLQAEARRARYRLMADWAAGHGLQGLALGHTLDDQAETVLMRLARGSGVDGLSAMAAVRNDLGMRWLRPLLAIRRDELRAFLTGAGIDWLDDPSNADTQFDRVKTRQALAQLAGLGIDAAGLAETGARLRQAREALELATSAAARDLCQVRAGAVMIRAGGFLALPAEIRRRLLNHALCWVARRPYPPRHAALEALMASMHDGRAATLHGCLVSPADKHYVVAHELSGLATTPVRSDETWLESWRLQGPHRAGLMIGALGETGLAACPDWRDTGLHRSVLLASPAVWDGAGLVAAPCAGFANGWRAEMVQGENDFVTSVLSH
jgi:tRNA(Ile)-lysidine synthase